VIDTLEPRQLLTAPPVTGPPLDIPAYVDEGFATATSVMQQKVTLFDSIAAQLLTKPLENSPTAMAQQLRDTKYKLQTVIDAPVSGLNGTFGSGVWNPLKSQVDSAAGQIETFGQDLTDNPRISAALPTSFDAGAVYNLFGFSISTPFTIWGQDGTAAIDSTSINLNSLKQFDAPNLPQRAVDTYRQAVSWTDSLYAPSLFEGTVMKQVKSADGLTERFFDVSVRLSENAADKIEGIFRQRDGAWIREVQFQQTGGTVTEATAKLQYLNAGTDLTLSYTKHLGSTGAMVPEWQGSFDKTIETDSTASRLIAKYSRTGEDQSFKEHAEAAIGTRVPLNSPYLGDGWIIGGAGRYKEFGQPEQTRYEGGFCLPVDVPLVGSPFWVGGSYSSTNGVGGSSSSVMNYFVPKDKPTLLFNVQQTAQGVQITPEIDLLPLLLPGMP